MAVVMSKVRAIQELYFHQLPTGRPVNVSRAVRVNGLTVFVGANGRLYCDRLGNYAYLPGTWPWNNNLMRALVKLGVITAEQMQEHLQHIEAKYRAQERARDAKELEEIAKRWGLRLTKAQRAALQKEQP